MFFCPFCKAHLSDNITVCPRCGYSVVLSLPFRPLIQHKSLYILLAFLSMVLGITSCVLSLFPYLFVMGLILVIPAIAFGAISLEGIAHKFNGKLIRLFAITGLVFGVLGYVFNVLINSQVGTSSGL
jgi:hypothetical protein